MKHDLLKTTLRLLLAVVMVYLLPMMAWGQGAAPSGGGSSVGDPYQISTRTHLEWMADEVNNQSNTFEGKYFKLQNDIDLSNDPWLTPIGTASGYNNQIDPKYFAGVFDGDGYKITGLNIPEGPTVKSQYQGLFGLIGYEGYSGSTIIIKNLCVEIAPGGIHMSPTPDNLNYPCFRTIGGIAGDAAKCTIENCYVTGGGIYCNVNLYNGITLHMGGIAGRGQNSTIKNCYSTVDITFDSDIVQQTDLTDGISIAGIVGEAGGYGVTTEITNCYYSGRLTVRTSNNRNNNLPWLIAGIAGNAEGATITNCLVLSQEIEEAIAPAPGSGNLSVKAIAAKGLSSSTNFVSPTTTINGAAPGYDNGANGTKWDARTDSDAPFSTWGSTNWEANTNSRYMHILKKTDGSAFSTKQLSVFKHLISISTAAELAAINATVASLAADYILAGDIDLSSHSGGNWASIGTNTDPFVGTFDGNGHRITGLAIIEWGGGYYNESGLFGKVGSYSYSGPEIVIKNLGVEIAESGIHINKNIQVGGGIASSIENAKIQNCYVTGGTIYANISDDASIFLGGIAGILHSSGTVEHCYSTVDIQVQWDNPLHNNPEQDLHIGGLVGDASDGVIKDCLVTGTMSATLNKATDPDHYVYMGGIAGYNSGSSCIIQNCLASNSGGLTVKTDIPANARIGNIIGNKGSNITSTNNYALVDIPKTEGITTTYALDGDNWNGGSASYPSGILDNNNWQSSLDSPTGKFRQLCYAGTSTLMPNQPGVKLPYKVNLASTANGSFTVDQYPWSKMNETVTITTVPDAGYVVNGLPLIAGNQKPHEASGSSNTYTFTMVPEDVTISVSFIEAYTVTIDDAIANGKLEVKKADGTTLVSGTNAGIVINTELTISATPNNSYRLKQLTVGSNSTTQSPYTVTVVSDITISAEFEPIPVTPPDPVEPDNPSPAPIYYTVTLPAVEGAITDPAAGEYEVESWSSFPFILTLDKEYDKSVPVVTTDRGETITPRTSDGAYIVTLIRQPLEIRIDGIVKNPDPVANEAVKTNQSKVWTAEGHLHIEATTDGQAYVFTADGRLQKIQPVTAGETLALPLPEGVYIVRIGDERFKVIL